jgi:hypothetical protein
MEAIMTQDPSQYNGGIPYTIEQAMQLLKELPLEGLNEKLVVGVMRSTLESAGVSISSLLEMSSQRQDQITNEIVRLQGEIASLRDAIEEKTSQVTFFNDQLADIGSLRERFEE